MTEVVGSSAAPGLSGARILVVDDEADIRMLLRLALERAGFEVEEATGGAQALERLLAEDPPDAVVLDLRMPEPDGWAVLEQLRSEGRLSRLKVIAASAHASVGTMNRALDAGCVAYLKKPFRVDDLRRVLRDVVGA